MAECDGREREIDSGYRTDKKERTGTGIEKEVIAKGDGKRTVDRQLKRKKKEKYSERGRRVGRTILKAQASRGYR